MRPTTWRASRNSQDFGYVHFISELSTENELPKSVNRSRGESAQSMLSARKKREIPIGRSLHGQEGKDEQWTTAVRVRQRITLQNSTILQHSTEAVGGSR